MQQTSEIVAHPESGKAVRKVTTVDFVEVERSQLEAEVAQKQAELDAANQALTAHNEQGEALETAVAKAQAALEDSKSNIATLDQISPPVNGDTGSDAASSESADADSEGSDSVPVPVSVETPADEADLY